MLLDAENIEDFNEYIKFFKIDEEEFTSDVVNHKLDLIFEDIKQNFKLDDDGKNADLMSKDTTFVNEGNLSQHSKMEVDEKADEHLIYDIAFDDKTDKDVLMKDGVESLSITDEKCMHHQVMDSSPATDCRKVVDEIRNPGSGGKKQIPCTNVQMSHSSGDNNYQESSSYCTQNEVSSITKPLQTPTPSDYGGQDAFSHELTDKDSLFRDIDALQNFNPSDYDDDYNFLLELPDSTSSQHNFRGKIKAERDRIYFCQHCGVCFHSKRELDSHLPIHHKGGCCFICNDNKTEMEDDSLLHHNYNDICESLRQEYCRNCKNNFYPIDRKYDICLPCLKEKIVCNTCKRPLRYELFDINSSSCKTCCKKKEKRKNEQEKNVKGWKQVGGANAGTPHPLPRLLLPHEEGGISYKGGETQKSQTKKKDFSQLHTPTLETSPITPPYMKPLEYDYLRSEDGNQEENMEVSTPPYNDDSGEKAATAIERSPLKVDEGGVTTRKEESNPKTPPPESNESGGNIEGGLENVENEESTLQNDYQESSTQTAFNESLSSFAFTPKNMSKYDILNFLNDIEGGIRSKITKNLDVGGLKIFTSLIVHYEKINDENVIIKTSAKFISQTHNIFNVNEIGEVISQMYQSLNSKAETFTREGSGWVISHIESFNLDLAKYKPFRGSSFIPTPKFLLNKRCIVNIKNVDGKCMLYSLLAHLLKIKQNPARLAHYLPHTHLLNMSGISYPTPFHQIKEIEDQNKKLRLAINVYSLDNNNKLKVELISDNVFKNENVINLLLLKEGEKQHYTYISNFNRLIGKRGSKKSFICFSCLYSSKSQAAYDNHILKCKKDEFIQEVRLPETEKERILKYDCMHNLETPFAIFADTETFPVPLDICKNNPQMSSTTNTHIHEINSYSYFIVCFETDEYSKGPITYVGPKAGEKLVKALVKEGVEIQKLLKYTTPMYLTTNDKIKHAKNEICIICKEKVIPRESGVVHHSHITGKYLGLAHKLCNLHFTSLKGPKKEMIKIPCFFHNASKFDLKLILSAVNENLRISCIANTIETYKNVVIQNISIIDSLNFLNDSLSNLIQSLKTGGLDKFKYFNKKFSNCKQRELLLTGKGTYPYSYVTNPKIFLEKSLPAKEHFFNDLKNEAISTELYEHANKVWNTFQMKTFYDYHVIYLESDVLFLADIMCNFRENCLNSGQLCPMQYVSLSSYSWHCMMKTTKVEIELLKSEKLYNFFENNMRGGITLCSQKYFKSNHPKFADFDQNKPISNIAFLDINSLYPTVMVNMPLPLKDIRWLTTEEIKTIDFLEIKINSDYGVVLECDLEIPKEFHDFLSDLPPLPERINVKEDMLSTYSKNLLKMSNKKLPNVPKLVPNLFNKKNYVIHYIHLQLVLKLGVKLTKIHKGVIFFQSKFLSSYISKNLQERKEAKDAFTSLLAKQKSNSIYGRTLMNVRKHMNVKLVTTTKKIEKLVRKKNFKEFKIFHENLAAVHLVKEKVYLNQPVFIGFSILELSKVFFYKTYYFNLMSKLSLNSIKLLYVDTDSYVIAIQNKEIFDFIKENIEMYDTSNFEKNHKLYDVNKKRELGLLKSETGNRLIYEFIGLKCKMYSLTYDEKQKNTAKGIRSSVIKQQLKHDLYRKSLFHDKRFYFEMKSITHKKQKLYTTSINKLSLSNFDDKRYVLGNGYETLALGHYKSKHDDS